MIRVLGRGWVGDAAESLAKSSWTYAVAHRCVVRGDRCGPPATPSCAWVRHMCGGACTQQPDFECTTSWDTHPWNGHPCMHTPLHANTRAYTNSWDTNLWREAVQPEHSTGQDWVPSSRRSVTDRGLCRCGSACTTLLPLTHTFLSQTVPSRVMGVVIRAGCEVGAGMERLATAQSVPQVAAVRLREMARAHPAREPAGEPRCAPCALCSVSVNRHGAWPRQRDHCCDHPACVCKTVFWSVYTLLGTPSGRVRSAHSRAMSSLLSARTGHRHTPHREVHLGGWPRLREKKREEHKIANLDQDDALRAWV